jgi:hypothetical protein
MAGCQVDDVYTRRAAVATEEAVHAPSSRADFIVALFKKTDGLAQHGMADYSKILYARSAHQPVQDLVDVTDRLYKNFAEELAGELDLNTWWSSGQGALGFRDDYRSDAEIKADKAIAVLFRKAEAYRPGIVLDKRKASANRIPIALIGKVFCKVDASYASVEVGDNVHDLCNIRSCDEGKRLDESFRRSDWKGIAPAARRSGINTGPDCTSVSLGCYMRRQ